MANSRRVLHDPAGDRVSSVEHFTHLVLFSQSNRQVVVPIDLVTGSSRGPGARCTWCYEFSGPGKYLCVSFVTWSYHLWLLNQ